MRVSNAYHERVVQIRIYPFVNIVIVDYSASLNRISYVNRFKAIVYTQSNTV